MLPSFLYGRLTVYYSSYRVLLTDTTLALKINPQNHNLWKDLKQYTKDGKERILK